MCYKVTCSRCGKYTWAGCGRHKDRVLARIAKDELCRCNDAESPKSPSISPPPSKSLLGFMNDNKYQPQKSPMYNLLIAAVQETTKQMMQKDESKADEKTSESNTTNVRHSAADYDAKESDFFKKNAGITAIKKVMINSNNEHPFYDLQSWKQEKWSITLAELILKSKFIKCATTLVEAISKLNDFEKHCLAQMKKRNRYESDYGLLFFLGFRLARSRLNMLYLEQMENKSHLTFIIPMYNAHKNNNSKDFVRRKVSEIQWLYKNISHTVMDWNVIFIDDGCPDNSGKKTIDIMAAESFCDRNCPCARDKVVVQFLEKGFQEIDKFKNDTSLQKVFKKHPTTGAAVQYGMYKALEHKIENDKPHFICYSESDLSVNIAQSGNLLAEVTINDSKKERVAVVANKFKIIDSKNGVQNAGSVVTKLRNVILGGLFPVLKNLDKTDSGLRIFQRDSVSKVLPSLKLYTGLWEAEVLLNTFNESKEQKEDKEYVYPVDVVWCENVMLDEQNKKDVFTNEYGWKHYNFMQEFMKIYKSKDLNQQWGGFVENLKWKDYFKICQVAFCNKYDMNKWNPTVDDLKRIVEKEVYPPKAPGFVKNMK